MSNIENPNAEAQRGLLKFAKLMASESTAPRLNIQKFSVEKLDAVLAGMDIESRLLIKTQLLKADLIERART